MTTRTIRETDITIHHAPQQDTSYGARYFLRDVKTRARLEYVMNYAEALQARADIIDERAGAARVGDRVRVGLRGQVVYTVDCVFDNGTARLVEADRRGIRSPVPLDRLSIIEAHR